MNRKIPSFGYKIINLSYINYNYLITEKTHYHIFTAKKYRLINWRNVFYGDQFHRGKFTPLSITTKIKSTKKYTLNIKSSFGVLPFTFWRSYLTYLSPTYLLYFLDSYLSKNYFTILKLWWREFWIICFGEGWRVFCVEKGRYVEYLMNKSQMWSLLVLFTDNSYFPLFISWIICDQVGYYS